MSITKEEIVWLMENCAPESPCGAPEEPSNLTIAGKPDHEIEMARKQIRATAEAAGKLNALMQGMGEKNLPAWVQSKITMASEYMMKVYNYLEDYLADHQMGMGLAVGEMDTLSEKMEGDIPKARHDVEIDVNISKSDLKKLEDGESIELKDKTGLNRFTLNIKVS